MAEKPERCDTRRIMMRSPHVEDGAAIAALIAASPPLDVNSTYCVLLQCSHFARTCILAERHGQPIGWISGYIPPTDPNSLFVWRVAVAENTRGIGLGGRMLEELVARPELARLSTLRTTVTEANDASRRLFERFADRRGGIISCKPLFEREAHFANGHSTEFELVIELTSRSHRN